MAIPFQYQGCEWSSHLPAITVGETAVPRAQMHSYIIRQAVEDIPDSPGPAAYVATGGGYGSTASLIAFEKAQGHIAATVPPISGSMFRNDSVFEAEKMAVKEHIRQYLGEEAIANNPQAVEQILSAFYSDEVNTKIAKEVVKAAFAAKKSVIHESASIYADTVERARLAKAQGLKTVLIAGDKDVKSAIAALPQVEPANTATSYQKFSARFENELVPLFDEIRLYNTDKPAPFLIAEKTGPGQPLHIIDPQLYAAFIAKKSIDPSSYQSATAGTNTLLAEHQTGRVPLPPPQPHAPQRRKS